MFEYLPAVLVTWWTLVAGFLMTAYGLIGWRSQKWAERLGFTPRRFWAFVIAGFLVAQAIAWFELRSSCEAVRLRASDAERLYQAAKLRNASLSDRLNDQARATLKMQSDLNTALATRQVALQLPPDAVVAPARPLQVQDVRLLQSPAVSWRHDQPHALALTFQVTTPIQPFHVAVRFNQPILDSDQLRYSLVGDFGGTAAQVGYGCPLELKLLRPPVTPETPLVLVACAARPLTVVDFKLLR